MGLLDELKQEADELKAKADELKTKADEPKAKDEDAKTDAPAAVDTEQVRRKLAPKMMALYNYFSKFNEHMKEVPPDVSGDYLLEGLGTLANLRQGDYSLVTDDPNSIQEFTFYWSCSREGRQEFKVENPIIAEKLRESLWNHSLRFNKRDVQNGTGSVFVVELFVPVACRFEIDPVKNAINLKVKNLGTLGLVTHSFSSDEVNAELMDEFAKCILRRPNRFDELVGEKMSDTLRQRLRDGVEKERERRNTELHVAEDQSSSVTQRLKGSLFGHKPDAE